MQELPDNPSWLLKQAVRALEKNHYQRARWLCWMELCRTPNNYFALCWYAHSLYHLRSHDQTAASLYKRAIEINPSLPLAHAGLGMIHHSSALRIHEEYKIFPGGSWVMFRDESDPEEPSSKGQKPCLSISGFADDECGNRKIAIKELEEAAELISDTDNKVKLLSMAAEIHCIISNVDGIKAYKKILRIAPDYIPAHFHLAGCYAFTYYLHKQSPPTSYYGDRFSGNDKLALKEYKFIKENAPELATDLESVLADFNIIGQRDHDR